MRYYEQVLWRALEDSVFDDVDIQSLRTRNKDTNWIKDFKRKFKRTTRQELQESLPQFTLHDLRIWAVGPYTLKLAHAYLKNCSSLKFLINQQRNVIKVQGMASRFMANKNYQVYLHIPSNNILEVESYCTCKSGEHTLGGCAHTMTTLFILCTEIVV